MLDKILVPLDGSLLAELALPYAAEIARVTNSKELTLLSIMEQGDQRQANIEQGYLENQISQLNKLWQLHNAKAPKTSASILHAEPGKTASEILNFSERSGVNLIVMSSHGRSGISRWLMGSVAEKVVRASDIPVLLIRTTTQEPNEQPSFKHILVPLDGSHLAEQALPLASEIAAGTTAKVSILHVGDPQEKGPRAKRQHQEAQTYIDSIISRLTEKNIDSTSSIRLGSPVEEILQEADDTDLLVIASHGRTGLSRLAFGSVAWQLLSTCKSPILLIKAATKGDVTTHLRGNTTYRCHNCGVIIHKSSFVSKDRCPRCRYFLKSCNNCVQFNGSGCLLKLKYATETYAGNNCPKFEFRKASLILR